MLVVTEAQVYVCVKIAGFVFFSVLACPKSIDAAVGNTIALLGGSRVLVIVLAQTGHSWIGLVSLYSTSWYCGS